MLSRFFKKGAKALGGHGRAGDTTTGSDTVVLPGDGGELAQQLNWLPGEVVMDGRYRIDRIFGGAMGKVYIAEHLGWGVWMAIKAPRPEVWADREGLQRILREANGWIRLGVHPNIASCYYVRAIDNIPYIFIEYVSGGTLDEWINRGRCRDMRTALSLAIQFCNGMEYTHSMGFIHRDIKPQNILMTKDGLVKITDFGILRAIENPAEEKEQSLTKAEKDKNATVGFRGTPNYASPEQLRNTHKVDRRTDVFSFGLCLWMMFCGKRPYKHNAQGQCPEPAAADPATELPLGLKDILVKSVAYHQDERFNNFTEMKEALNQVYFELFRVSCPYAIMGKIDMRAENLNNRAVSLAELGKYKQALNYLSRTLEVNDSLPEALYNSYVLMWRKDTENPERLLRRIEATKKRFPKLAVFDSLEKEIKNFVERNDDGREPDRKSESELQLCFPKAPTEIFREAQLRRSVHHNILTLLQNRRLTECCDTLMISWGNEAFKKDKFYYKIYEQMLPEGKKGTISAVQRLLTHPGEAGQAAFLASIPERKLVFSAAPGKQAYVRSIGQRKNSVLFSETEDEITSLAVSSSAGMLVMGQKNGTIVLHPFKNMKKKVLSCGKSAVQAICFSRDEKHLLLGLEDGQAVIYSIDSGKTNVIDVASGAVCSLVPLGGLDFAAGCDDGSLRFFDGQSGECLHETDAHVLPLTTMSVSPNGRCLATGSADRQVRIWDSKTRRCLQTLDGHEDAVSSVLLLADEKTVVVGCEDDIIKLWDLQSGNCKHVLDARGDGVSSLAQGPKPHTFLAGRQDGAIILWAIIYQLTFDDGRPSALRSH
ncbi:MAG: protein kinase [Desulfobulbaceae bacterium]|nr:protein kinase [Desulfobulbaceae bacterium]